MISKKCFYNAITFKFSIQIITLFQILIYLLSSSHEKVDLRPRDDLYNFPSSEAQWIGHVCRSKFSQTNFTETDVELIMNLTHSVWVVVDYE